MQEHIKYVAHQTEIIFQLPVKVTINNTKTSKDEFEPKQIFRRIVKLIYEFLF